MKKLKLILAISLIINAIAIFFAVRRVYSMYQERYNPPAVSYPLAVQRIYDALPIDSTDIVFLGDSHILYFPASELLKDYKIKTRGISGDVLLGVLARTAYVANSHPQKIFLEIGSNDMAADIPVDTCINRMVKIINVVKKLSPKTIIYVQSVIPRTPQVPLYNQKLKLMCQSLNVTYIDIFKLFQENGSLSTKYSLADGIHLNGNAYMIWASTLKPYLQIQNNHTKN